MTWRERERISRAEAAQILGVSDWTVDKLCHEGRLQRVKEGRRALIPTASVRAYLGEATPMDEPAEVTVPSSPAARASLARALQRARR